MLGRISITLGLAAGLALLLWKPRVRANLEATAANVSADIQVAYHEVAGPLGVPIVEALTSPHPTPAAAAQGIAYMTAAQPWLWANPAFVGLPLAPTSTSVVNFGGQVSCERYSAGRNGNVQY